MRKQNMHYGYVRVSTDLKRQNVDLQINALMEKGVEKNHIYVETMSGSQRERPVLDKLIINLQRGDTLIVWKLDRLGRSLSHLLDILQTLKSRGVHFKSVTEGMDTVTPQGEFYFQIFGALAQYERSLIQERVKAGLKAARQKGRVGGRPRCITPATASKIQELHSLGRSNAEICHLLSLPKSTLYDFLKSNTVE